MADFAEALPYLLANEGGFSDDSSDHGGRTNLGITQRTLDAFRAAHPDLVLPDDVAVLTEDEAGTIYHAEYWRFDGLTSQKVATKLLDMSANMGLGKAVELLQRVLGHVSDPVVVIDGVFGPKTEQAANSCDESELLRSLAVISSTYYIGIVHREPDQQKFLHGWLARAEKVPA